jgi:hypothetical protein
MSTIVSELEWRLRELQRESQLRGDLASESERSVMQQLLDRLKGSASAPSQSQAAPA